MYKSYWEFFTLYNEYDIEREIRKSEDKSDEDRNVFEDSFISRLDHGRNYQMMNRSVLYS